MKLTDFLNAISDETGPLQSRATDVIERMSSAEFGELTDTIKALSGKTIMGVGDGGGNLFIHGEYEAIKMVQRWYAELMDRRSLGERVMKQPVVLNIDDLSAGGFAFVTVNPPTKQDLKSALLAALKTCQD